MAIVGSVTLDKTLNPAFMRDVRGFIMGATEAANLFREDQCRWLLQEAQLTASRSRPRQADVRRRPRPVQGILSSRAQFLGFTAAALIKRDGDVVQTGRCPAASASRTRGQAAGHAISTTPPRTSRSA